MATPPDILKSKKKGFHILGPPLRIPGHAPDIYIERINIFLGYMDHGASTLHNLVKTTRGYDN